ncbi:PPOX class F420-dependent oxidoreductase [Amycolatopsis anabasis]|uniref:PPOX class F420-dependent oxidoreductase n=1 Tax=Amycolatopsis anabasis TaxID=1840409 RepID=UPI00131C4053|nr:PPOX class F420-dependent oxidoreductase [Amycolatopsis anabasis]
MTVSQEKLQELLDSPVFATVATIQPDGSTQQSVVWILRDRQDVRFMMAVGSRKERNIRRDPRISVLVSPPDAPYTYAVLHGAVVLETEGRFQLRDELSKKYIGVPYAQHIKQTPEAGHDPRDIIAARLTPHRIVGRL